MYFGIAEQQIIDGFGLQAAIVIIALVGVCALLYKDGQRQRDLRVADLKEFSNKTSLMIESMQENNKKQLETSEKIYDILVDGRKH